MAAWLFGLGILALGSAPRAAVAAVLLAGVAKVEITDAEAGPVNDPLFAKALVLRNDQALVALVTLDAVATGEIGYIKNDYLAKVRSRIQKELGIAPANVLINASHCHGVVRADVDERTVEAVRLAMRQMVPVKAGVGAGHEDRIMENRRLTMKDGSVVDMRRAYSLPPDGDVADVGPVDPQIGLLRLDRLDGQPLALVYNFACHPIEGVPGGGNTADLVGFASQVIEENLGHGAMALFVQGCAGDINPAYYKDVERPRNAEVLGSLLGLSTLKAARAINTANDTRLQVINETVPLPRADFAERIAALEGEQTRLLRSLKATDVNFKSFLTLAIKHNMFEEFPSYHAQRYLHERKLKRADLERLDAENRRQLAQYLANIHVMEQLTRTQTNLELLRKNQAKNLAAGKRTIDAEVAALRVGPFVLVTFPGELTVQIGLGIKERSPIKPTFVAGYTNGYLYYAATAEQLRNPGTAQEDCDCLLAPEWQELFEAKVEEILKKL
jgi:hypothetical protein